MGRVRWDVGRIRSFCGCSGGPHRRILGVGVRFIDFSLFSAWDPYIRRGLVGCFRVEHSTHPLLGTLTSYISAHQWLRPRADFRAGLVLWLRMLPVFTRIIAFGITGLGGFSRRVRDTSG